MSSFEDWLGQLRGGDEVAAARLWEDYFPRLVGVARAMLSARLRRVRDEEDLALSALASLCRELRDGQFDLAGRDKLWQLLVAITRYKVRQHVAHESCARRGGGRVRGDSALEGSPAGAAGFDQVAGPEPTPEFVTRMAETCQHLLGLLPDPELRQVALWKMEGYTNQEIAVRLNRLERRIEKKLQRIRTLWMREGVA